MNGRKLHLKRSAFKHGISLEDIQCAVNNYQYNKVMEEDEEKWLLLGFDTHARLLEIIYNEIDDQTIRVFHANKCRAPYEKYLFE
jgi:uncharacterized DUF497 family protein